MMKQSERIALTEAERKAFRLALANLPGAARFKELQLQLFAGKKLTRAEQTTRNKYLTLYRNTMDAFGYEPGFGDAWYRRK